MDNSNDYCKAIEIATNAHLNQYDKGGNAYIQHPLSVANMVDSEECKIVAILHDVVEDSEITLNDLIRLGFNDTIINAVDCISKRKHEEYNKYLFRVASNSISSEVKKADLKHNMDITRLSAVTQKDVERIRKYQTALNFLEQFEFESGDIKNEIYSML